MANRHDRRAAAAVQQSAVREDALSLQARLRLLSDYGREVIAAYWENCRRVALPGALAVVIDHRDELAPVFDTVRFVERKLSRKLRSTFRRDRPIVGVADPKELDSEKRMVTHGGRTVTVAEVLDQEVAEYIRTWDGKGLLVLVIGWGGATLGYLSVMDDGRLNFGLTDYGAPEDPREEHFLVIAYHLNEIAPWRGGIKKRRPYDRRTPN